MTAAALASQPETTTLLLRHTHMRQRRRQRAATNVAAVAGRTQNHKPEKVGRGTGDDSLQTVLFAALMAKDYPTAELAMSLGADPALVDRFGKKKSPRAYLFRLAKLNLCGFPTNRAAARTTGRTACQHASANGAGGEFLLRLARGGGEVFGPPPTHPATKLLPILDKFAAELDHITIVSSAGRACIASALAAELAVLLPSMPDWVARALADPLRIRSVPKVTS